MQPEVRTLEMLVVAAPVHLVTVITVDEVVGVERQRSDGGQNHVREAGVEVEREGEAGIPHLVQGRDQDRKQGFILLHHHTTLIVLHFLNQFSVIILLNSNKHSIA